MNIPKLVIKNLTRKKGRFLFTLLGITIGITIGIASFVTLLSLGGGLKKEINKQASDLGANLVVTPKGWCAYEQVSVLTGEQLPEAIPLETVRTIAAIPGLVAVPYLTERTAYKNNPISVIGILPEEMRRFKNWEVEQGKYFSAPEEKAVIGSGIAKRAILAAAFGIINTMMTAISERRREIGIIQAIGAPRGTIFSLFFLESGLYGLSGGVLGVVGGLLFSIVASPYISQNEFTTFMKGTDVAGILDLRIILGSILFSVAVSLVSGLYPAWKAARLTPVEAIAYE